MDNLLLTIIISDNQRDNIVFTYYNTANMTYRELYRTIFNFMRNNRRRLFAEYNLRFDDERVPENWYLTDADNNELYIDNLVWPNYEDMTDDIELFLYLTDSQDHDDDEHDDDEHDDDEHEHDDDDEHEHDDDEHDDEHDDDDEHEHDDEHDDDEDDDQGDYLPVPGHAAAYTPRPTAAAAIRESNLTVVERYKKNEYVSREELQAFRDAYNTMQEEQNQIWKDIYYQKLIAGNTGIGISCNYNALEAVLNDKTYFEVSHVSNSGAAESAGILVGDRIVYAAGTACQNIWEFKSHLLGEPSSEIELILERNSNHITVKFNRNPSRDASENSELVKFAKLARGNTGIGILDVASNFGKKQQLSRSSGGNRKRLSKKSMINRKRISKKAFKNRKRISKKTIL